MIAALDAHYNEATLIGTSAAVVFEAWESAGAVGEYRASCSGIQPYVPGEFFKRELPCVLAVLDKVREPLNLLVIDGYVTLGEIPGLGMRLWEALNRKVPVIGVAKTRFRSAGAIEVIRGRSKTPLFITAVGVNQSEAAINVARMAGDFRIPTMLKRADQLARSALQKQ